MKNKEIKIAMIEKGLKQWQVAEALGIHESVFSRMLRNELPEDEKKTVLEAIAKCGKENENA